MSLHRAFAPEIACSVDSVACARGCSHVELEVFRVARQCCRSYVFHASQEHRPKVTQTFVVPYEMIKPP
eukprot:33200-Eustigmatos_ZCMA.PRE.1